MATLSVQRRSSVAERRGRQTKSPLATDDIENSAAHLSTRRSRRSTPLLALDENSASPQTTNQAPPTHQPSRKRPASVLSADAPQDTRPPTKVSVTQPHGELLRITNGVSHPLGIDVDDVPSGMSTPRSTVDLPAALPTALPAVGSAAHDKQDKQDKRSLRSHDGGSRLKSDLAIYFSSYDDIIAGVEKQPEFLELETPIYIIDEPLKTPKTPTHEAPSPTHSRAEASPTRSRKARPPSPPRRPSHAPIPPTQSSTAFQVLDYSTIARHIHNDGEADPLADSAYFTHHRRAERKEKQLRNIEKERAMHEKVQLERLLDGLQGPDWLKVMGITGVTDGERKDWEPKRDFFIKEVEALVDKFRIWKEEEKRLRAEKEAALAAREDDDDNDDDDEESEASADTVKVNGVKPPPPVEQRPKDPEPPRPRRPPRTQGFLLPYQPPEPSTPFTSFYAKPHVRAAAMGKHRHGRNLTAFGLPIPDFEEHEFQLPDEYIDPVYLRDNARKRRRQKRESGVKP